MVTPPVAGQAAPLRDGALDPFRTPLYTALWSASLVSNFGTWVQNVAEKWQMASMTRSPLLIALIEAATTLPLLFLSIAGGAVADIVDRRRLLLVTQTYMALVAAALAVLTFSGMISPAVLIVMALLLGAGMAINAPAWQAILPEVLPRHDVPAGVALNSAQFNISRAIGPALGGALVGAVGAGYAFAINAASFVGTIVVVASWRRASTRGDLPAERFWSAMRLGLRYVRYRRPLKIILLKAGGFAFCGGTIFSLLPSLAIHELELSSTGFGLMLGTIGAGAVSAALVLPRVGRVLTRNATINLFTLVTSLALLGLKWAHGAVPGAALLFVCGFGWLSVLSTLSTGVQLSVPSWVKARAFGVYTTAWGGALAAGSIFWGSVAQHVSVRATYAIAGAALLVALSFTRWLHVQPLDDVPDMDPHRPEPHPPERFALDDGPILTILEYRVPVARAAAFREAMREVRRVRVRDGASRWSLFEEPLRDGEDEIRFVESFFNDTWGEHLRLHRRATVEDREIFFTAYRMNLEKSPRVRHLLASGPRPTLLDGFLE